MSDNVSEEKEWELVHLTIPSDLLKAFDEAIKRKYQNRSEAIRYGMRLVLKEFAVASNDTVTKVE